MTRWARVGNSQKHKKLPEDATPWEDFWQNKNKNSTNDAYRNRVKSGRIEKKILKQKKKFGFDKKEKAFDGPENKNNSKFRNVQLEESESNHVLPKISANNKNEMNKDNLSTKFQGLSKNQLKKAKKKAKLQQLKSAESNYMQDSNTSNKEKSIEVSEGHLSTEFKGLSKKQLKKPKEKAKLEQLKSSESNGVQDNNSKEKSVEASEDHLRTEFQGLSKNQLKKAKKVAKLQQLKSAESNNVKDNNISMKKESMEVSETANKSPKEKDFQGKKKLFMQKLEKKRKDNGILLLPAKVERKLYIIKKRLREKGLPPAAIRDIARKERRKEELKFRGSLSMSTKPCFNCRQIGHFFAECPMALGNSNQETGLCFKCGSTEHTSYKCPTKIEGYPLAKCFVCKEQGHISKDCPKNEHGVYIKGGKCSLCGNVNHLRKDCPTLKKKIDEEEDIAAYTINEEKSIDAEIIPTDDVRTDARLFVKKGNKAKVVKF